MKTDGEIELMLKSRSTGPRISPDDIDEVIVDETFTVLPSGKCMVCELTLTNGFTVRGEASCVVKENFDQQIGREVSRRNAREKIWQLEGYLLQEKMHLFQKFVPADL